MEKDPSLSKKSMILPILLGITLSLIISPMLSSITQYLPIYTERSLFTNIYAQEEDEDTNPISEEDESLENIASISFEICGDSIDNDGDGSIDEDNCIQAGSNTSGQPL